MFWKGHHQAAVIMFISVTLKVSIKIGQCRYHFFATLWCFWGLEYENRSLIKYFC